MQVQNTAKHSSLLPSTEYMRCIPSSLPGGPSCPEPSSTFGAAATGRGTSNIRRLRSVTRHHSVILLLLLCSEMLSGWPSRNYRAICNPDDDTFGGWLSSVENSRAPTWNRPRESVNRHLPTPPGQLQQQPPVWCGFALVDCGSSNPGEPGHGSPADRLCMRAIPTVKIEALEPRNSREAVSS